MFVRQLALFNKVISNPTAFDIEEIDESYEFLLSLVAEPKDRKKAKNILMGLSASELQAYLSGVTVETEPDPKESGQSEDG